MEEEFLESEVIFSEDAVNEEIDKYTDYCFSENLYFRENKNNKRRKKNKKKKNSVPVNIPENKTSYIQAVTPEFQPSFVDSADFFDDDDDGEELVPPHLIVARRIFAGKVAFSVCTGNGRTLKGRDLSEVRNSILKLTGFLES